MDEPRLRLERPAALPIVRRVPKSRVRAGRCRVLPPERRGCCSITATQIQKPCQRDRALLAPVPARSAMLRPMWSQAHRVTAQRRLHPGSCPRCSARERSSRPTFCQQTSTGSLFPPFLRHRAAHFLVQQPIGCFQCTDHFCDSKSEVIFLPYSRPQSFHSLCLWLRAGSQGGTVHREAGCRDNSGVGFPERARRGVRCR